jgi:KTSC domain-containing protein
MKRQPVSSSVMKSIGYDRTNRILEIEFHNDRLYRYFVVPHSVYQELLEASSPGRFFNERIRDRYPSEWVI